MFNFKSQKNKLFLAVILTSLVIVIGWLLTLKYSLPNSNNEGTRFFKNFYQNTSQAFNGIADRWNQLVDTYNQIENVNHSLTNEQVVRLADKIKQEVLSSSQEQIKEDNWLIYNNESLGFSFKYPESWSFADSPRDYSNSLFLSIRKYFDQEVCVFYINAGKDEIHNPEGDDYKDFVANGTTKISLQIDNIEADYLKLNKRINEPLNFYEGFGVYEDYITFDNNNINYQFIRVRDRNIATEEIQNNCSTTFKQILASFKFLK